MAEDQGIEVATITIRKLLTADDYEVHVHAVDEQGDDLALLEALGLLEFAKLDLAAGMFDVDEPDADEVDEP